MGKPLVFAPAEVFNLILDYMVIPTFDLVIEYGHEHIIIVRRRIAPYRNVWALPGLRMYKHESIDEALQRIALKEVGLAIDTTDKLLLGQYVGRFKTEHERQDLSTGYLVRAAVDQPIRINTEHFYSFRLTRTIPHNMGAMYRYYLEAYFRRRQER